MRCMDPAAPARQWLDRAVGISTRGHCHATENAIFLDTLVFAWRWNFLTPHARRLASIKWLSDWHKLAIATRTSTAQAGKHTLTYFLDRFQSD